MKSKFRTHTDGTDKKNEPTNQVPPRVRNVHSPDQLRRLSRLDCWNRINYLRKLTDEFRKTEMHRDFVGEALLFGVIVIIAAWPLVSLVERMAKTFP